MATGNTEEQRPRKKSRRVIQPAAPGVDDHPGRGTLDEFAPKDSPETWGDSTRGNDERLKNDKPPHWG